MGLQLPPYHQAFELSQDFYLIVDGLGRVHYANQAFLEAGNWTQNDLPLSISAYLNGPVEGWIDHLVAESGSKIFALKSDKGALISAEWSSLPYEEDYHLVVGKTNVRSIDYQSLVDSYQHMAFLLDAKGHILAFNAEGDRAMSGVSQKPMAKGQLLKTILPERERTAFNTLFLSGLDGKKKSIVRRLVFENDNARWLEITVSPVRVGEGITNMVLITIHDITAQKEAEEHFKELEISYRSIFRQLAAGILLYDLDLRLIQANQGVSDLLGYSSGELEGMKTWDFTHQEDREYSENMARKLINGELDHYSIEKRYIHKNGQVMWCMLTATIVSDLEGKPKHVISVIQDISHQKRTEEELRFKKNELDAFVYRASHDLKGPVNSLLSLYGIAAEELEGQTKALEYLNHYHRNIGRLHDIIGNLLELTKIKDIKAHFKPVKVDEVVQHSLELLDHLPNYENIEFDFDYELPGLVITDQTLITTIIQNLLENAIKYSNTQIKGEVNVSIRYQEDLLTIQVSDNGIGIREDVLPKIFNMFYRATDQASGSGLGLYLLKNAVDKLEGTIDIESAYGEGTTFTIFIPAQISNESAKVVPVS